MFKARIPQYLSQIEEWDRVHRIIGRKKAEDLYAESVEALGSIQEGALGGTLVDIGAGAGILGVPFVLEGFGASAVLVEPDPKKEAFLRSFVSSLPREMAKFFKVLGQNYQNVSRETLAGLRQPLFFATRAFSGSMSFEECVERSSFREMEHFVFKKDDKTSRFVFERLKSGQE